MISTVGAPVKSYTDKVQELESQYEKDASGE